MALFITYNDAAALVKLVFLVSVLLYIVPDCADAQIEITALTPQEALNMPDSTTVVSIIASSLLASSTPGVMWGTIPSDAVASVCTNVVETGAQSFSVSVAFDSNHISRNMQIQALGGCGAAGDDSADGVEAVLQDDDGAVSALVCPQQDSADSGCFLFDTGDDISSLYYLAASNGSSDQGAGGGGRRKLLGNCFVDGTVDGGVTGAIGGVFASIFLCEGAINIPCDIAVTAAAAGVGAGIGVLGSCTAALPKSGCFPGDALVATSLGTTIPMSLLALGDEVAVRQSDGKIAFSPIYAFGHADPNATALFIELTLHCSNNNIYCNINCPLSRSLKLTPDHLALSIHPGNKRVHHKRAKDFHVGDLMLVACDITKETHYYVVTDIMITMERGLYNPFTLMGNIIVDGVVASVHSAWFLDHMFDVIGIPHLLHEAYQMFMFPLVLLHRILGLKLYNQLYYLIDESIDIPNAGTLYGGHVAIFTTSSIIFSIVIALKYATKSSKKT